MFYTLQKHTNYSPGQRGIGGWKDEERNRRMEGQIEVQWKQNPGLLLAVEYFIG